MSIKLASGSNHLIFTSGSSHATLSSINSGLIGHWKLDGDYLAKDATPYSNDGTLGGTPTPSLTTDRKGQSNKAYSFTRTDGSNASIITIGDPTSGIFDFGTADFSISFWMRVTGDAGGISNQRCLFKGAPNHTTSGYCFFVSEVSGQVSFALSDGQGGGDGVDRIIVNSSGGTINDWQFIVGRRSGSTMEIYRDNVLRGTNTPPDGSIDSTALLTFGATSGQTLGYKGKMSNIRIYNRALTTAEMTYLYNLYL